MSETPHQPKKQPTLAELWFSQLTIGYIHNEGWEEVNKSDHDLVMRLRTFALETFPDDPEKREAFIDGFTAGLVFRHREDFAEQFEALLQAPSAPQANRDLGTRPTAEAA